MPPTCSTGTSTAATDVFVRNISGDFTQMETLTSSELALTAGGSDPDFSGDGRFVVFQSRTNQSASTPTARSTSSCATARRDHREGQHRQQRRPVRRPVERRPRERQRPLHRLRVRRHRPDPRRRQGRPGRRVPPGPHPCHDHPGDPQHRQRVANEGGNDPTVSADGNKVAFSSESTNLAADSNGTQDTFVRDIGAGDHHPHEHHHQRRPAQRAQLQPRDQRRRRPPPPSPPPPRTPTRATPTTSTTSTGGAATRPARSRDTTGLIQHSANDFNGADLSFPQLIALNDRVLSGVASPESTIDDLAHGTFDNSRGPVMRLYWAFFKRVPDLGGLNYWVKKHQGGMSLKMIANSFAKSNEFTTKFGGGSDTAFITLVYTNVLERQPDPAGLDHWVDALKKGGTRGEMMINFSESSEGIRKMRGEIDTILISLGLLHRLPTPGEFAGWVGLLESGWSSPPRSSSSASSCPRPTPASSPPDPLPPSTIRPSPSSEGGGRRRHRAAASGVPGGGGVPGVEEGVGAAVDHEERAAEEAAARPEQEGDHLGQLGGGALAAGGDRELVDELPDGRVLAARLEQRRLDRSGGDDVERDAGTGPRLGRGLLPGPPRDRRLGRRVAAERSGLVGERLGRRPRRRRGTPAPRPWGRRAGRSWSWS